MRADVIDQIVPPDTSPISGTESGQGHRSDSAFSSWFHACRGVGKCRISCEVALLLLLLLCRTRLNAQAALRPGVKGVLRLTPEQAHDWNYTGGNVRIEEVDRHGAILVHMLLAGKKVRVQAKQFEQAGPVQKVGGAGVGGWEGVFEKCTFINFAPHSRNPKR